MADLSVTPSAVVAANGVPTKTGVAGAAIAAGEVVYLDTVTTGKWQLADSDAASAEVRGQTANVGIALNSAAANQPIVVQTGGQVTLGSVLTAGQALYLSDTPGKICPLADVTGGDYYVLLGLATSATVLALDVQYSGVASA